MLIRHADFRPDCTEHVNAELPPRISEANGSLDDDGFAATFIEALARTRGAATDGGDCIRSSCIGLAMAGEALGRMDETATTTSTKISEQSGRNYGSEGT